jgi:hypothetical protein
MPQARRCAVIVLLFSALAAGICGCGSSGSEALVPVRGKVGVGGAPLDTGSVTFQPDASKGNSTPHIPVGTIEADGIYSLQSAGKEGAPPGWYKVAVTAQAPIDAKNPYAPPKHLIHPKYSDPNTSGISVEVVGNAPAGAYDIQVSK